MTKKIIICICLLNTIIACNNKIETQIKGVWVIDELIYDNVDARHYFYSNALIIQQDTCVLPLNNVNESTTNKKYGRWNIEQNGNKYFLTIHTTNVFFNDKYEITKIWKDCNNNGCLIRMTLQSDSTYIRCSRNDFL